MAPTSDDLVKYRRVSTDEQATRGVSLEAQDEAIGAYCRREGLCMAEGFCDPGRTGGDMQRPGLQGALHALDSGCYAGVIVSALDRLTRSIGDFEYLLKRYFLRGYRLVVVHDQVDLDSAAGRMLARIRIVVGQHELERTAERTAEAMTHKRSRGERLGTVPYGWRVGADGKMLERDHFELGVIGVMQDHRRIPWSYRRIAAYLNEMGAQTRRGGQWTASTVAQILARHQEKPDAA